MKISKDEDLLIDQLKYDNVTISSASPLNHGIPIDIACRNRLTGIGKFCECLGLSLEEFSKSIGVLHTMFASVPLPN